VFKGVAVDKKKEGTWRMDIDLPGGGERISQRGFDNAEEAARAYDDAVRQCGITVVNFPREGELQAVARERRKTTLARAGIALPPVRRLPQACELLTGAAGAATSIPERAKLLPRSRALPSVPPPPPRAPCFAAPVPLQQHTASASVPFPNMLHGYLGVAKQANGAYDARFPLLNTALFLGGGHATAADAARVHDAEARARGALHRLNFPTNAAERSAAEEFRRLGPGKWRVLHGSGTAAAAPLPTPAPRKRGRPPRAQPPEGWARKKVRLEDEEEDEEEESEDDDAAGAPQSELQRVEAFLRGIRPPLSQARLLACCVVHAEACIADAYMRSLAQIDAVVAALPGSGFTMAHLAAVAKTPAATQTMASSLLTAVLQISAPSDQLALFCALDALKHAR
jgi:hypothetical protein